MIAAPALPESTRGASVGPRPRVLALVEGDRARDERTLSWACGLSEEHGASLTVLCLWSPPPMWPWIALSGAGAAVELLELYRRELLAWLHERLEGGPAQPVRVLSARYCESPARLLAAELRRDSYAGLVGTRRTIGRRTARRLRRRRPELTLLRL